MSAVADGTETVESGDAEGGGEIAIGASAGGAFAQSETHLRGERSGFGEERGTALAFERSAIETAANFEFCAGKAWTKRVEFTFEAAHVRDAERAEIEDGAGTFGDDVRTRSAFDNVGVDGHAASEIVPLLDARQLARKFVDGVDAFLWGEACVRGAAMNDEFGFAYAFASGLDEAFWAEGRFEDEDGIAATSFRFDEFSRSVAADLLVGGPEKKQAVAKRRFRLLQSFESEEGLDDAGFHIKDAGAIGFSGGDAEGHFAERAGGIDRVVVAQNEILACGARFLRPPGDAELVAAEFLRNALNARAALAPFGCEQAAATVGGDFFETGRFRQDETLERGKHLGQTKFQEAQELFGVVGLGHSRDMLTTTGNGSKRSQAGRREGTWSSADSAAGNVKVVWPGGSLTL
jgi:hypothetical protein